jgi:hypothetical protein
MNNVIDLTKKIKQKTLASIVRRETLGVDLTQNQIYKLRVGTALWFDADDSIVVVQKSGDDFKVLLCPVNRDLLGGQWENFGRLSWFWLRHVKLKRVGKHRASSDEFKTLLQRTTGVDADIEFVRTLPQLPEINPAYSM